jgi:phosphoglycolate phosphatase-like HAD superfamily hydrolase
MRVILFDIDGTLVNTGGAGRDALYTALDQTFGIKIPHHINLSGRTDRGITAELFAVHGIEHTAQNWEKFRDAYLAALSHHLPERKGFVLPGVAELVAGLKTSARAAIGLLTGNVREGARRKLAHYDLADHFSFGGFGDVHAERDDVAREALSAARRHLGIDVAPDLVWVIGDTPLDVRCARAIGAKVVDVATGSHDASELSAAGADLVVENLAATSELLVALLSE